MTKKDTNKFTQMKKNTVSSENQLKDSESIRFINPGGKGRRVLFAGNSITLHAPKTDIGWNANWGMAASAKENDYVHLIINEVKKSDPDAAFCISQVAAWEGGYKQGSEIHAKYADARAFDADVIICRFIENCSAKDFDEEVFAKEYAAFVDYLNLSGKAKIIVTTGFWHHPGDDELRKFAAKNGYDLAELGDLGEKDEMKAIGLFEHEGVANHPGDKGMQAIAARIMDNM